MHKDKVIFRRTNFNRFTLPILIHLGEKNLDPQQWDILIANSKSEILEGCSDARRCVVCYSFMTPDLESIFYEVRSLKEIRPDLILIAGGPHPSADPEGTLRCGLDVVFVGEGENILREYFKRLSEGRIEIGTKEIIRSSEPVDIDNSYPISETQNWFGPLEITRGCPFSCSFCQTPRLFSPFRHRSIDSVVAFIDMAREKGRKQIKFLSPNALLYGSSDPKKPDCNSIGRLLRTTVEKGISNIVFGTFPSEVRPDCITHEVMGILKEFCSNHTIVIGAQSGSRRLLEEVFRGHDPEEVIKAVSIVTEFGFRAHVDFIFGLPGEDEVDREKSLDLMKLLIRRYRAKIHAHTFIPLPGTPIFKKPPSTIDNSFLSILKGLERDGVLDGEWERQLELQKRIIKWRDDGLILSD